MIWFKLWWHCLLGTLKLEDHRMCQYQEFISTGERVYNVRYCSCQWGLTEQDLSRLRKGPGLFK